MLSPQINKLLLTVFALIAVDMGCSHGSKQMAETNANSVMCEKPGVQKPIEYTISLYARPPKGLPVSSVDAYVDYVNQSVDYMKAVWPFAILLPAHFDEYNSIGWEDSAYIRELGKLTTEIERTSDCGEEPVFRDHLRQVCSLQNRCETINPGPILKFKIFDDSNPYQLSICPLDCPNIDAIEPTTKSKVSLADFEPLPTKFERSTGNATKLTYLPGSDTLRLAAILAAVSGYVPGDYIRAHYLKPKSEDMSSICSSELEDAISKNSNWEKLTYDFFIGEMRKTSWAISEKPTPWGNGGYQNDRAWRTDEVDSMKKYYPISQRTEPSAKIIAAILDSQNKELRNVCWPYIESRAKAAFKTVFQALLMKDPELMGWNIDEYFSRLGIQSLDSPHRLAQESQLLFMYLWKKGTTVSVDVQGDWRVMHFKIDPTGVCKHARPNSELLVQ